MAGFDLLFRSLTSYQLSCYLSLFSNISVRIWGVLGVRICTHTIELNTLLTDTSAPTTLIQLLKEVLRRVVLLDRLQDTIPMPPNALRDLTSVPSTASGEDSSNESFSNSTGRTGLSAREWSLSYETHPLLLFRSLHIRHSEMSQVPHQ